MTVKPVPAPIRAADLAITPWKNQAGRKADIASGPGWTFGYAWLDGDAPFSDYAGHDRTITLVEGAGFTLCDAAGAVVVRVDQPLRPTAFDGGARLWCRVTDGPCRVMNVMTERAISRHDVAMIGDQALAIAAPAHGETRLLVALRGALSFASGDAEIRLEPFDAIMLAHDLRIGAMAGRRAGLITLSS